MTPTGSAPAADLTVEAVSTSTGDRVHVLRVPLVEGVVGAFTGRGDGDEPVGRSGNQSHRRPHRPAALAAARAAACAAVGATPDDLVLMQQVHGTTVREVTSTARSVELAACDAAVTTAAGPALGVLTADCLPVLLANDRSVGVAHAGREGLHGGVLDAIATALGEPGVAVIGPAVHGCCYEVPSELQERVAATMPSTAATTTWGTPSLDLPAGARVTLEAAGWEVRDVGICTVHDERFMSHRRDPDSGRQLGLVRRLPS